MGISNLDPGAHGRRPWNAGNMVGAKRPLKPRDVWAIRFFLDEHRRLRDRALFDLAIDSKLRGCDIVKLKIGDIAAGGAIRNRATVMQQKSKRPVQFEIMTEARQTLLAWLNRWGGSHDLVHRAIDRDFSLSSLYPEELVTVIMDLFAELFPGLDRHQHQLEIVPGVQYAAEVGVLLGEALNIVGKAFHDMFLISHYDAIMLGRLFFRKRITPACCAKWIKGERLCSSEFLASGY